MISAMSQHLLHNSFTDDSVQSRWIDFGYCCAEITSIVSALKGNVSKEMVASTVAPSGQQLLVQ